MSRVGKKPIEIPQEVTVKTTEGKVIVSGSKGQLELKLEPEIKAEIKDNQVLVERQAETKSAKSLHGLTRTLIDNMIKGVTQGFSKTLELQGTGYRVSLEGNNLKLLVGFSHPIIVEPLPGIQFQVEGNNIIKVSGIDKQLVGQVSASIRSIKKPDPYKGKGIRYQGEKVKKKPGKAAKVGAAAEG